MNVKKALLLFFVCFVCANFLLGQTADYGKKIVQTLASSKYKGRGYVGRGDKKAADFIAKQFKQMRLAPLGANGYLLPYSLHVNYFPSKMQVAIDNDILRPGIDYLISETSPSVHGIFPIIVAARKELLDSASLFNLVQRAKNGFLYVDKKAGGTESKEETDIIAQNLRYLQYSPEVDMKGIIAYSPDKLTWSVAPVQQGRPLIELHKTLDVKSLKTIQVDVDAKMDSAYQTQDVAAFVKGTAEPDSFLVVTAHYDHLGMMGKKTMFPGANDNASGTAMMLSLAKYFSAYPAKYSMVFIAFSGEEIGLKGSEYFVNNAPIDLKKIKFLCNFDMAGTGIDGIQVVNSTIFKTQYDSLLAINNRLHLLKDIKPRGETRNSDHYWFYKMGVPSFFIYTLGGVNYHDVNDTYESLPFTSFAHYEKLMISFLEHQ